MDKYDIFSYNEKTNKYDIKDFSGTKKETEKYLLGMMEMFSFTPLDMFSVFKIFKNGKEISIEKYIPILP